MNSRLRLHARRRTRGAALLIALLVLTLVATAAAAMVWHQQRAIEVEAAERARAQAGQILLGALDWARLIMRTDADKAFPPSATWARRLEESRVSSFLAADQSNSADTTLEVFLSGQIDDAQSRYNLRRLMGDDGKPVVAEVAGLRRLCEAAGASAELADRLADGLLAAWTRASGAAVPPSRVEQLVLLGVAREELALVTPYLTLLPTRTPVNANTAEAPALLAAIDKLDLPNAQRIVQALQRNPAPTINELRQLLPPDVATDEARVDVRSRHFDITARLRFEDRAVEERWLVERKLSERGPDLQLLRRDRRAVPAGGS